MFRRRDPAPIGARIREFLSPKKGWQRGYQYMAKRMQRLPDTPHRIALGFACGVQVSFTPFFFFHFVTAAAVAFAARGNILASALGTFAGNPVTFPFIAAISIWLGGAITGMHVAEPDHGITVTWLWENLDAIFIPYLVGGLAPGLVSAVVSYYLLRPMVAAYQARRRTKLMARARDRVRHASERRRALREARAGRANGRGRGGGRSGDGAEDAAR